MRVATHVKVAIDNDEQIMMIENELNLYSIKGLESIVLGQSFLMIGLISVDLLMV